MKDFTSIIKLLLADNNNQNLRYSELIGRFQEKEAEKSKLVKIIGSMSPGSKKQMQENVGLKEHNSDLGTLGMYKSTIKGLTKKYNSLKRRNSELEKKYKILLSKNTNCED